MKIRRVGLLLLVASGCSGDRTASGLPEAPLWRADAELVIGDPSDPSYVFHEPLALRPTASGEVVTLHHQERRIRIFDSAGRYLRDLAGPGDVDGPIRLEIRGDTAWVLDRLLRTEFRLFRLSDGSPLGARIAGEEGGFGSASEPRRPVQTVGLLGDGSYLARPGRAASDDVARRDTDTAYLRMTADGLILDTLAVLPRARITIGFVQRQGEGGIYGSQPFSDDPLFAVSPHADLVYVLDRRVPEDGAGRERAEFRLVVRSFDGSHRAEHTFLYRPRPMRRSWVDQVVRSWQAQLGMAYSHSDPLIRGQLYVPAHQPPVAEMHVASDGRVWLREWDVMVPYREYQVTGGAPPHAAWLVLSPAGEVEGRLELPLGLRWLHADGDLLWGSYTDPVRGARIVRYRLAGPGA